VLIYAGHGDLVSHGEHPPERGLRSECGGVDQAGPGAAGRALALALSFLAPPRCGICGGLCGVSRPACDRCVSALDRAPVAQLHVPELDVVFAALAYESEARALIAALKFRRLAALARVAAEAIAAKVPAHVLEPARIGEVMIVPVPPSPARLRSRGLDPAEEIALALGRLTGSGVERCLGREEARRQVGRPRRERLEDPPRFHAPAATPESVLLVDDVTTTGATLSSCARALRTAGSRRVAGVTFASAERRWPVTRGPA
jgi:predicted amidophosphoribosyltransferase